ncbi:hypothetical protein ASPVEDRAFT_81133 [Aspergillus versicolor CBS 583.65]|uniref:Alpha/beta hydrolase fold-3 domain-containing protein n=1 Tax=Aspergillus versicolor CBS 583.65 TaxID=1036611 RepID=A0A1L9PDD3_ASPVE|nr:uncharacterized protein ASPVEDRAFT_81133 [Aspergillus versicolor CBS 583.65]OJI99520.1 hypothetical protein ASPVEDRAFT_81133 [Aspergillus versicolor CBS 583.65]
MDSQLADSWLQFVHELGFVPVIDGPYESLMQGWGAIFGKLMTLYKFPPPDLTVETEDRIINGIRIRIYIPPDAVDPPVALYFHAGGWIMGGVDEEDGFSRALSKASGTTILSVGYRLAPAYEFPTPLEDCVHVAQWALETYAPKSVSFIGASAGGNLAFSTALSLVDKGLGDRVQGVIGIAPVTVHPDAVPVEKQAQYTSYRENDRATINTGSAMRTFLDCYGAPPEDPRLSCLLHPRLGEMNKAYMAIGGADTLRDDVRLMEQALTKLAVPVRCDEYPGFPPFSWLFPSPALKVHQRKFFGNLVRGIQWVQE